MSRVSRVREGERWREGGNVLCCDERVGGDDGGLAERLGPFEGVWRRGSDRELTFRWSESGIQR